MLLNGIKVSLNLSMDSKQCNEILLSYIKDKVDITNKQLLVYLAGGFPFISGTIGDIVLNKELKVNNVIYGVLTKNVSDEILNKKYFELCNIKDQEHRNLISPLVDSTDLGLSDMACLLGYINHDGIKSNLLLNACATLFHFPPFIVSYSRIMNRNSITGRDVITVTSTFYTYFRALLPLYCPNNKVYEFSHMLCNLIYNIEDLPEKIPIITIDVKKDDVKTNFLSYLNIENPVYFWIGDTNNEFLWHDINIRIDDAIENYDKIYSDFTPVEPYSLKYATGCKIVKGKTYEYLYLMQSSSKNSKTQNCVDIIDPMNGVSESKEIESFAISQFKSDSDIILNKIINPYRVKQILVVNFDESKLMDADLEGNDITSKDDNIPRITIAFQYLNAFLEELYYSNITNIQSLVSFNDEIVVKYKFGCVNPNCIFDCLKKTASNSASKLFDSLLFSCDEIVKFRKDNQGNEIYKNAISRILVISAGVDNQSTTRVHRIVRKLIKNKIIVDCIVLNKVDKCKTICAICHATGGLCFRPNDISEGLDLIEQSAFVDYEERENNFKPLIHNDKTTLPSCLEADQITSEFIKRARNCAKFDDKILNKILIQDFKNMPLATPITVCAKYSDCLIPTIRRKRILYELHEAAHMCKDEKNDNYDPDIKIYPIQSNIEIWEAFIKGSYGTPYESKWWQLIIKFPEFYPFQPPIIKFVTVPYHVNVSIDGQICIDILRNGYQLYEHVVDILQKIKELFLLIDSKTAITVKKMLNYRDNRDEFNELARESANTNDINDLDNFLSSSTIVNEEPEGFLNINEENIPSYMEYLIFTKKPKKHTSCEKVETQEENKKKKSHTYDKDHLKKIVTINPITITTERKKFIPDDDVDDYI